MGLKKRGLSEQKKIGRRILSLALLITVLAVFVVSCSVREAAQVGMEDRPPTAGPDHAYPEEARSAAPAYDADLKRADNGEGDGSGRLVNNGRRMHKVIQRAQMNIVVDNVPELVKTVEDIAADNDGMVTDSNISKVGPDRHAGSFLLRVPQNRFNQALLQLETLGEVEERNVSREDVTMQYLDLEARIKSYQSREKRYLQILNDAQNVEEILNVERELDRIREQLEIYSTQFKYLQDEVAFSFIDLYLTEEAIPTGKISPSPFGDFGQRLKNNLIFGLNIFLIALSSLITVVVFLLPFAVIIAGIVLLIRYLFKRKRNKINLD